MSETPRTDALIAAADACPETRMVFLIKNLANLAKDLERECERWKSLLTATQRNYVRDHLELSELKEHEPPIEFDKCPDGKTCSQTTTGCLKGQCRFRMDELSTIHHALLNPTEVVYDPKEPWVVRTAKEFIIAAVKAAPSATRLSPEVLTLLREAAKELRFSEEAARDHDVFLSGAGAQASLIEHFLRRYESGTTDGKAP
jgi:hypothetical protein